MNNKNSWMTPPALAEKFGIKKTIIYEIWENLLGKPAKSCLMSQVRPIMDELERRGLIAPQPHPTTEARQARGIWGRKCSVTYSLPMSMISYIDTKASGNASAYIAGLVAERMSIDGCNPADAATLPEAPAPEPIK